MEHPAVVRRVLAVPMATACISSITKAELLFGLARRPEAKRLHTAVGEFLRRVDVLPWDSEVAERYGATRAAMERQGKTLGPLDLLIASHALRAEAVLVTNDRAFAQVDGLRVEDWTADAA
jgi:tRNA(fMet)-specific endonuclease VapC